MFDSQIYNYDSDKYRFRDIILESIQKYYPDVIDLEHLHEVVPYKLVGDLVKKIGKDISLITFDGSVVNSISSPSITAVTHDRKQLGKKAIEILTSNQKTKLNYFLAKPKIIERGSVHQVKD